MSRTDVIDVQRELWSTRPAMGWRDEARVIVAAVVRDVGIRDPVALRKALYDAYPFGERRHYPYKAWLQVVKEQIGGMRAKKADPRQMELFGVEPDHQNETEN
jgi:hypothetical protein